MRRSFLATLRHILTVLPEDVAVGIHLSQSLEGLCTVRPSVYHYIRRKKEKRKFTVYHVSVFLAPDTMFTYLQNHCNIIFSKGDSTQDHAP